MTSRTRTDVLLIAGFCIFLFFYGLGQFGLIGADEPRYAQVAREMLDRHDWVTPVLGGQPWLEKPPLYYWQAMVSYSLLGISDTAARVPSAIDATLMVFVVYLFFRRFRHALAADAALIVASCAGTIGFARAASPDMPLAASFTIGMLGWWSWRESGKRVYLAVFYLGMALGMLAKGPVAPLLAAVSIALFAGAIRETRLIWKTLWIPGILLFCVISLPWYIAVQSRNPQFFHVFILEHNLARFSRDLYHHREPFWYYLPVTLLALLPWTVFVATSLTQSLRTWWSEARAASLDLEFQFNLFLCSWLIVPVIFFSLSQSKLPGYILPAIAAGALLLADYLRQRLQSETSEKISIVPAALHGLVAAVPLVPAILIAHLLADRRLPAGKPMLIACAIALVVAVAITVTLLSKTGYRMLRFVTLIPVILTIAAVLKIGGTTLDRTLSVRPVAVELAEMETHRLPVAVYRVPREVEYGLSFYRSQAGIRYEAGQIPPVEHLVVAPENSQSEVAQQVGGRRVSRLGHYAPQHLDYFWVAAAPASH